jgi:AcrR family transcriptional regulator
MPRRPPPAKLSRADSQARTRARLLATATACFLRDGYAETSMEAIAASAGFTKGAVYSNFTSKVELCLAVLDAIRAERIAALGRAVAGAAAVDALAAALDRWADDHIGDPAWTRLEVEFGVHASRTPGLGKQLARRHQAVRARVGELIAAYAAAHRLTLPLPAADVGVALLSLGVGLGVQRALDPTLPVHTLATVMRLLAPPAALDASPPP